MRPIERIRKVIFNVPQEEFGVIAGTTQSSVSRWEKGDAEPDRDEMARIRAEALNRGIPWDDRWFFEIPQAA